MSTKQNPWVTKDADGGTSRLLDPLDYIVASDPGIPQAPYQSTSFDGWHPELGAAGRYVWNFDVARLGPQAPYQQTDYLALTPDGLDRWRFAVEPNW
jgi:hypothetical protein